MSKSTETSAFDWIAGADLTEMRRELKNLRAIRAWATRHLGIDYAPHGRVQVIDPRPAQSAGGWKPYAGCLSVGSIGTVGEFKYDERRDDWYVMFRPDVQWKVWEGMDGVAHKVWKGRPEDLPEGFEPPSKYEVERYPEGKFHVFAFNVEWLAAAPAVEAILT